MSLTQVRRQVSQTGTPATTQTAGSVRRTARDLLGADEHEAADALGVTVAQLRSLEEDTAEPDDAAVGAFACRLALGVRIARVIA